MAQVAYSVDNEELFEGLQQAGASEAFVRVLRQRPDSSVAREIRKQVDAWGTMPRELPTVSGGHFFEALWDGDVERAMCRADMANGQVMREVFGITREEARDAL
jgi:hypothetical protein